jgi:hypothetical protein
MTLGPHAARVHERLRALVLPRRAVCVPAAGGEPNLWTVAMQFAYP